MSATESALVFDCEGERLVGVLCTPQAPLPVGVVIVVGGPQYRAGSHRQFVLLARDLARDGAASLRFDYRGMGDSTGEPRDFEHVQADIRCAIDALLAARPELRAVVLWGLCDAASAAMMYAPTDTRVAALVLVNPWARAAETLARTHLRHYYVERLLSRSFWASLLSGGVRIGRSLRSLAGTVSAARARRPAASGADFRAAMLDGLERFRGEVLFLLSGRDLTAQEFLTHAAGNPRWQPLIAPPRAQRVDLPDADHTLSDGQAAAEAARCTAEVLRAVAARVAR